MDCLISLCWLERAEIELSTSTDIKEIELLCSLFPFEDRSIPYSHLTRRGPTTLEGFLKSLGDTEKVEIERGVGEARLSEKEVRSLRLAGRLGIVLRQRQLSSSPGSAWDWKWKAPDKSTTAKSISDAMMLAFCTVTFADWIRTSFGYYAQSFSKVTGWMSQKREMVRRHLKETPQLRMHYEQLEKASPISTARQQQYSNSNRNYAHYTHGLTGCLKVPLSGLTRRTTSTVYLPGMRIQTNCAV